MTAGRMIIQRYLLISQDRSLILFERWSVRPKEFSHERGCRDVYGQKKPELSLELVWRRRYVGFHRWNPRIWIVYPIRYSTARRLPLARNCTVSPGWHTLMPCHQRLETEGWWAEPITFTFFSYYFLFSVFFLMTFTSDAFILRRHSTP